MVVLIQGLEVLGDWAGGDYSLRYSFFLIYKLFCTIFSAFDGNPASNNLKSMGYNLAYNGITASPESQE